MSKKILFTALFIIFSLTSLSIVAHGATGDASSAPFDLELNYPENQNRSIAGYFDINLGKGKSQELSVTIKNNLDSEIKIDIAPLDCYTHPSGGLYYDKNPGTDKVAITDKKFMWSDNISVKKQITIPSKGSYNLPFTITVPQVDEGEVIAALNFSTEIKSSTETETTKSSDDASFSFNVRKSITMAIKVNIATPATLAKPSIAFGDVGFDPATCRVFYNLENKLPIINDNITGNYEILSSDSSSLFSGTFDLDKMAPKTLVQIPIPWNASTLQKGNYIFKISINADSTVYSFEKSFEITKSDIKIYSNTSRVQLANTVSPLETVIMVVLIIAVLAFFALLIYFIFVKNKKRKDTEK